MKDKMEKFCSIYYNGYEVNQKDNIHFLLENKDRHINTPMLEMITFINDSELFKKLNDVYLIKIKTKYLKPYYIFYFKYENIKFCLSLGLERKSVIKIDYNNEWVDIYNKLLLELGKDEKFHDKIKDFISELKNELTTNTKERIQFLFNIL